MKNRVFLISILFMMTAGVFAQSAIVPVGGDAQSNGGSVSYTVGQVVVQTSSNGTISVAEGVQQPYEIMTVGVDDYPQIVLNAVVYPNPTENIAQLQLNGFEIPVGGFRAIIYDGNGKMLQSLNVTGTYYLELRDSKRLLKTFKVVRK